MISILLALAGFATAHDYPLHILPDATTAEYEALDNELKKDGEDADEPSIQLAKGVGNRNLEWLRFMNSTRSAGEQIALTRPGQLHNYPIERPNRYSPSTVEATYNQIYANIPAPMKRIIFENGEMTRDPGVPMDDYINWAKQVDRMYQSAVRWSGMRPNLNYYRMNAYRDIRGYYFLQREENLEARLRYFSQLPEAERTTLGGHLVNMCLNNRMNSLANCQNAVRQAATQNTVWNYYQRLLPTSKALFDGYFNLYGVREDIAWTAANPLEARLPVRNTSPEIENFLRVNVEDEWDWNGWHLRLDFTRNALIHVEFEEGVTPHVSNLNTIVMDQNSPLTEWDVMWTIRHEFGHALGFKDCYVEFYDSQAQAMVNYQIDVTNLMCSRTGIMQERHYNLMKETYYRP
jgi:hypothetical protein